MDFAFASVVAHSPAVLVVDIGGSRVKLFASRSRNTASFKSGNELGPDALMRSVKRLSDTWEYDVVSLGYPGATGPGGVVADPGNLGAGWVGFDFAAAFGRPVRVVNDAAMQALGAYEGGRMLFLGLGTGLGSTIVGERVLIPLELGCLRHSSGDTLGVLLGKEGLARLGEDAWRHAVHETCAQLRLACGADYIVLGGGNAALVDPLPPDTRRGGNEDAFTGGVRLWQEWMEHHDTPPSDIWRVVW
ncbi:MAG: ROK family protein [Acidobacteria bacterium]|nr:ROK family protein [Acidobacteriota bacterium]